MSIIFDEIPRLIACRLEPATSTGILGSFSIDSRNLKSGEVFIALNTEQADGHDYIHDAFNKGAQAAFVNRVWFEKNYKDYSNEKFIVVEDTLASLQQLARAHRKRFKIPVIALTGSNGKTSAKELLAAALETQFRVLKSPGNFNNHIGVPLTLLQLDPDVEILLLEMGTNQPGDIELLCSLAIPDYGLVLNIGPAHLMGFINLEGVAREKSKLLRGLPPSGAAFINVDDPYVSVMKTSTDQRFCFGLNANLPEEDCFRMQCAEDLGVTENGCGKFRLRNTTFTMNWPGRHQISNGLAAATVADYFGIPMEVIAQKFASIQPIKGRLNIDVIAGITVIDDAYNANPGSTLPALELLRSLPVSGKKFVVIGDHLELGQVALDEHIKIGKMLVQAGVDGAFLVGTEIQHALSVIGKLLMHYQKEPTEIDELVRKLLNTIKSGDAVLIKGSRGMALDRIIREIRQKIGEVKD
jgi:UDP-N-acetylmuramoyl-tripeptide--D-alanyl-D-alanine ligase